MGEAYLTLEQNICAARIFLNAFGFILEDVSGLDEFTRMKIYDKSMNKVGELYFDNGKIIMMAKYSKCVLNASYDISKVFGLIDRECGDAIFGSWSSRINFQIQSDEDTNINGEILVGVTADSEFGISCLCHPLIKYQIKNKRNIEIKILRDGLTFGAKMISGDYNESIEIRPFDDINGFILHDIKNGEYDKLKHEYPYRRYAGVFNGAERGENKDKLHVFMSEDKYNNNLSYHDEYIQKIGNDESSEAVIQKGLIMQNLDKNLIEKIGELRKMFLIDDISLLDNFISICYDNYTTDELKALLGVERENMIYQNGAQCLTDSYFGIGSENKFFSLEQQKRLLKK